MAGSLLLCIAPADAALGPSVRQVVEFTRLIQPDNGNPDQLRTQVSPDGARAFVVTRTADVATDQTRFDILLLDVRAEHLSTGQMDPPRRLLRVDATKDDSYSEPFLRDVRWVGNQTLVFLARMHDGPAQVYRLEVESGALQALTSEARPIVSFAAADDPSRLVYVVQVANPPMQDGMHSVVVGNQSFWSVKFGQNDLRSQQRWYQYCAVAGDGRQGRSLGAAFPEGSGFEPGLSISPDGRWALLPRYVPERQAAWARQYPLLAAMIGLLWSARDLDPLGYYSRASSYTARQMVAYRLVDGHEQIVVDAPDDAPPGPGQIRSDRLWFGGGRSVVLAGTHLPIQPGGPSSGQSYIVEYWPDRGEWAPIAALEGRLGAAYPLPGRRDAFVAIDGERKRSFERQDGGGWRERMSPADASTGNARVPGDSDRWDLKVVEGLNQPPDVVAVGPQDKTVRLTALNPQFAASSWGVMQPFSWVDGQGRRWDGGLLKANDVDSTRPRALVIQTYGFSGDRFYLDGANAYDGYTSGFAGRAFLASDIAVLAMPVRPVGGGSAEPRARLRDFADGVRSAIAALVGQGLVDPARVGIMGWSATGEQVLNLVTFSNVPIRVASLLDGDANTLFSLAVTYGATDSIWSRKRRLNEGLPYGEGLERWVRYDPALHTDCVRSALRIETYGPWVLNNWDIYALLRQQLKPVEMVVIPGGTHALSRPSERMLSLQGNVDWHRFWLQGEERIEPLLAGEDATSLRAQYGRWRQMEALKRADDSRPPCTRSWEE